MKKDLYISGIYWYQKTKFSVLKISFSCIMTQSTQINVRMDDSFLNKAKVYAEKNGFSNVQKLMKETLRERLFNDNLITKEELLLVKKLMQATEENKLWETEEELFSKLKR